MGAWISDLGFIIYQAWFSYSLSQPRSVYRGYLFSEKPARMTKESNLFDRMPNHAQTSHCPNTTKACRYICFRTYLRNHCLRESHCFDTS